MTTPDPNLSLQADEIIRAVNAGEKIPAEALRAFILAANANLENNRKTRIKEEAKLLKPTDVDFF